MSKTVPQFVWYELMTTDCDAAEAFYRTVMGWSAREGGVVPGRRYTIVSAGGAPVGGLMPLSETGCATVPGAVWSGYVGVENVDASVAQVREAGGKSLRDAEDIPEVGRFAVVADPYGAVFLLFQPARDEAPPQAAADAPGHVGWRELHTDDGEGAIAFYASLFGWTKGDAIDMGGHGVYQIFSVGGVPAGGVMTRSPDAPAPFWLFYFNVEGIDAATSRVRNGGGRIIAEPMQVPTGSWIAPCLDPQGAIFALVSKTR